MSNFWYEDRHRRTKYSAQKIMQLVAHVRPFSSAVDVGCGIGTWLAAAQTLGATKVLGFDGPHVPLEMLEIDPASFRATDLTKLVSPDEKYDLAISVEVAEHLPPSASEQFVRLLCESANCVIFSAAIPGQGGNGHINECPTSYWANLFRTHRFELFDFVRPAIWTDDKVLRWYRQNVVVFCKEDMKPALTAADLAPLPESMVDIVHPEVFEKFVQHTHNPSIRVSAKRTIQAILRRMKQK